MNYLSKDDRSFLLGLEYLRLTNPTLFVHALAALQLDSGVPILTSHYGAVSGTAGLGRWGGWKKISSAVRTVTGMKAVQHLATSTVNHLHEVGSDIGKVIRHPTLNNLMKVSHDINPMHTLGSLIPSSIGNKMTNFEEAHRQQIKIAGAVAAIAVGGFMFAPAMLSSAASAIGTYLPSTATVESYLGKVAVAKVMSATKIGGHNSEAAQAFVDTVSGNTPNLSDVGTAVGDDMTALIAKVGQDKVNAIANAALAKYGKPTGPTSPAVLATQQGILDAAGNPVSPDLIAQVASSQNADAQSVLSAFNPSVITAAGIGLAVAFFL